MSDVKLGLAGDRVTLSVPWSPSTPNMCKSIAGARWDPDGKQWHYPLDMGTLRQMRAVFGDRLAPSRDLVRWSIQAVEREKELKALAGQRDAILRHVPTISPRLADAMGARTYQRVAARFAATAGSFLLADEPGLGKTATALAGLMESEAWSGDVLVIAPKSALVTVWARQIKLWSGVEAITAPEGRKAREAAWSRFVNLEQRVDQPRFFVVNPAMLRRKYDTWCNGCGTWEKDVSDSHYSVTHTTSRRVSKDEYPEVLGHAWSSVILDESHDLLATVKSVWGNAKNKLSMQTQGLFDLKSDRRYALTGTPLRGKELRVWGTLAWLDPAKHVGYWAWVERYFSVFEGYAGGREIGALRPDAHDAFTAELDQYMLRRTRSEVRSDLPDGQILDVLVEMTPEQRKQYTEFLAMGEAQLRDGLVSGQGVLAELTRLKQLAYGPGQRVEDGALVPSGDGPKYDWLVQWLAERGVSPRPRGNQMDQRFLPESGGYKYVIASQFTAVLDSLQKRLFADGIETLKITGDVTGRRRDVAQEIFQDDTRDRAPRVMLINTKAGGVSIELDAWCDEMVILDETWVQDDQVQLRGRIDNRSGRVAPRTFWYVRTAETIEQSIAERNFAQADLEHALLDGRRGVESALHLMRRSA